MTTQLSGWFTARQNPSLISGGMTASVRLLKCRWGKCRNDETTVLGFKDSASWLTPCRSAHLSVSRLPATVPRKTTSCLMTARSAAYSPSACGADFALRPRQPILQQALPGKVKALRHDLLNEPQRRLLRQRAHGKLLGTFKKRTCAP